MYFPHLTTLFLHRLTITKDLLCILQQNTTYLRYLNISPVVSCDKRSMQQLIKLILSLLYLQNCRLRLGMSMLSTQIVVSSQSPIKNLRLTGINEFCFIDRLISFLQHLPYLQSLHITANQLNLLPMKNTNNVSCTVPISTFTLNIKEFPDSFVQFTHSIACVAPYVRELKIICRNAIQNLIYVDHLIWIKFVQSLPNLHELTLDINRSNEIDERIWDKKCQNLIKSMIKNHVILKIGK